MLKTSLKFLILLLFLSSRIFSHTETFIQSDSKKKVQIADDHPLTLCRINTSSERELKIFTASDNESIFTPLANGNIKSVNPNSNTVNWQAELGGEIVSPLYLFDDALVSVSRSLSDNINQNKEAVHSVTIRLLDKKTGIVRWQAVTDNDFAGEIILHGFERALAVVDGAGNFYLFDKDDGKTLAHKIIRQVYSVAPVFSGDRIFLATTNKEILEISAQTFEVVRTLRVPEIPSRIFYSAGNLIWSDQSGRTTGLRLNSRRNNKIVTELYKQKWSLRLGGKIESFTPFQNNVLIASLDNYLYSISSETGESKWKRRLSGRPAFQPLLTEKFYVVTTVGDSTALLIDPQFGKILGKINIGNENFFVGSPKEISSLLFFSTNSGNFFYASEATCRLSSGK